MNNDNRYHLLPLAVMDHDLCEAFLSGDLRCLVFRGDEIRQELEPYMLGNEAVVTDLYAKGKSPEDMYVGIVGIGEETMTGKVDEVWEEFAELLCPRDMFEDLIGPDCDLVTLMTVDYFEKKSV